jgi:hypothetical protein
MADVDQKISDFYRVATERDFARDFQMRVLSINTGDAGISFDNNDLVYVRAAKLPARAITMKQVQYMGLPFNIPGNSTYPGSDAYTLEFYADAKSNIRKKFEDWTRNTFDDTNSTGNYFTPKQTSTIDLITLDNQLNKTAQYRLVGVAIKELGEVGYNISEGTGEVIKFTVTLSYHYYRRID